MSTSQNRQPTGVATGGQFAQAVHAEPEVALGAVAPVEQSVEVVEARAAIAGELGISDEDVTVSVNSASGCGRAHGSSLVEMTARVPGDPLNQEVSVGFERGPQGGSSEAACEVSWDITPLPTLTYTSDSTTTPFRPQRDASRSTVATAVCDTLAQARAQRALNTAVNTPQHVAQLTSANRRNGSWYDVYALNAQVVNGQLTIAVEDRRGGHPKPDVRLNVTPEGQVTGGTVETVIGRVELSGETLDRACRHVDWELAFAQDRISDASTADRARLESRFGAILAGADL
jgi:hypothetical protein